MDARTMKKHILATALVDHYQYLQAADPDAAYYSVAMTLDLDDSIDVTKAQYKRYMRVLVEMMIAAEDKL